MATETGTMELGMHMARVATFVTFACCGLYGQERPRMGEALPDLGVTLLESGQRVSMGELINGGYALLNFWGKWCAPCVRELPKLDSLRKALGGRLRIVNISADKDRDALLAFLESKEALKDLELTFVVDTAGTYQREFAGITKVWLDPDGIIRAKTPSEVVTYDKLFEFVRNGDAPERYNQEMVDKKHGPVPIPDSGIHARSILAKGSLSVSDGMWILPTDADGALYDRIFIANRTIKELFLLAAFGAGVSILGFERCELRVTDSLRYCRPREAPESFSGSGFDLEIDWKLENTYVYELSLPEAVPKATIFAYMLDDLKRYFPSIHFRFDTERDMVILEGP